MGGPRNFACRFAAKDGGGGGGGGLLVIEDLSNTTM